MGCLSFSLTGWISPTILLYPTWELLFSVYSISDIISGDHSSLLPSNAALAAQALVGCRIKSWLWFELPQGR